MLSYVKHHKIRMSVQGNDNMQYNGWKSMLHKNPLLPPLGSLPSCRRQQT